VPSPSPERSRLRLGWLDALIAGVLVLGVAGLVHQVNTKLDYHWDWSVVGAYLVRPDPDSGGWRPNLLLIGLLTTVRLALWAGLFAAVLGAVLGLCRTANALFLRILARLYVDLIRSLPPLVIIFIFYFFLSSQIVPLLGIEAFLRSASPGTLGAVSVLVGPPQLVPAFLSAMICLALFEAAYVAEIVRAGIQSIERGQWEAAGSLGLKKRHTMRLVILPQAIQRVVPPLTGQFISLIKDSSIASLISVQELAFMAAQVSATTGRIFEVWISASAMYFALCFGLALLFSRVEHRLARGLR
jgi:polar amino acid transport system permease protein